MFKISAFEFGTMSKRRRMQACTDEFLATVTEGVVHDVYKVPLLSKTCNHRTSYCLLCETGAKETNCQHFCCTVKKFQNQVSQVKVKLDIYVPFNSLGHM